MRSHWIASLMLMLAGCGGQVTIRPQTILRAVPNVQVTASTQGQTAVQAQGQSALQADANVQANVHADAEVHAQAEVDAHAQAEVQTQVEVETRVAVPIDGSVGLEFFGVPLTGARDVVFVLDRSGSMAETVQGNLANLSTTKDDGPANPAVSSARTKIDVAQQELIAALTGLPEGTVMNVIFFSDWLEGYAPQMVTLQASARDGLVTFVKASYPSGSTALAPAMRTAFLMNARRVVLLSDGLGNVGGDSSDVMRDAREAMLGGVRIDTIGLGSDQDTDLMRSLASESGGIYQDLR